MSKDSTQMAVLEYGTKTLQPQQF